MEEEKEEEGSRLSGCEVNCVHLRGGRKRRRRERNLAEPEEEEERGKAHQNPISHPVSSLSSSKLTLWLADQEEGRRKEKKRALEKRGRAL